MAIDSVAFSAFVSSDVTLRETIEYLPYNLSGRSAVIPVSGILSKENNFFSSLLNNTSYTQIYNSLTKALADKDIETIWLDIDSPGGEISGLFDLVDFISESKNVKPIYAIANDHAFSAAYAIASAASKIFVNRTSGVGSIGVISTHVDISEMDKKAGIKYTYIFAGDHKNDLSAHAPISEDAIISLQQEVNRLHDIFVESVSKNRKVPKKDIVNTQAKVYYGIDAINEKLADEIYNHNLKGVSMTKPEDQIKEIQAKLDDALKTKMALEAENIRLQSLNSDEILEQKLKMADEDIKNAKTIDDFMETKLSDSGLRGENLYNKALTALGFDLSKTENKREAFGIIAHTLKVFSGKKSLNSTISAANVSQINPVNFSGDDESMQEMKIDNVGIKLKTNQC